MQKQEDIKILYNKRPIALVFLRKFFINSLLRIFSKDMEYS